MVFISSVYLLQRRRNTRFQSALTILSCFSETPQASGGSFKQWLQFYHTFLMGALVLPSSDINYSNPNCVISKVFFSIWSPCFVSFCLREHFIHLNSSNMFIVLKFFGISVITKVLHCLYTAIHQA